MINLINKIPGINIGQQPDILTPGARERLESGEIGRDIGSDLFGSESSLAKQSSITVDSTVNVSVPDGTPEQIQQAAREQGRLGAIQGIEQALREAQTQFPLVE
jgi:hypothetical protein